MRAILLRDQCIATIVQAKQRDVYVASCCKIFKFTLSVIKIILYSSFVIYVVLFVTTSVKPRIKIAKMKKIIYAKLSCQNYNFKNKIYLFFRWKSVLSIFWFSFIKKFCFEIWSKIFRIKFHAALKYLIKSRRQWAIPEKFKTAVIKFAVGISEGLGELFTFSRDALPRSSGKLLTLIVPRERFLYHTRPVM